MEGDAVEIHHCRRFVLRRQATADRTVVTKTLHKGGPGAAAQVLGEYSVLRKLDVVGVVRPIALEGPDDRPTLVLEDVGSENLEQRLAAGPLPLEDFFKVALQLAESEGASPPPRNTPLGPTRRWRGR